MARNYGHKQLAGQRTPVSVTAEVQRLWTFFGAFGLECIVGLSMDMLATSFKSYRRTALSRTDGGTRGAGLQVFGSRASAFIGTCQLQ